MRRVFVILVACCAFASTALAGGAVDLYGAYGEVVDSEAELGLGLRFSLGGTHWMIDAGLTAFQAAEDITIVDGNPADDDNFKLRVYDLGLRYLFYDGQKLRPYVGGGVSLTSSSATYARVNSGFGFYGLAGLRYGKTPGIQLMGELAYRWAEADVRYGIGQEEDVTVGGLALQLGVSFVF